MGSLAFAVWTAASSLVLPVLVGGSVAVPDIVAIYMGRVEIKL